MRLATNIVIVGAMIGAGVLLKKVVRSRRAETIMPGERSLPDEITPSADSIPADQLLPSEDALVGSSADEDMVAVATESGIADVDPEPISHVAGEGIDLDRDIAAHEEIAELRERLPRV
jgi:hypothetical protein